MGSPKKKKKKRCGLFSLWGSRSDNKKIRKTNKGPSCSSFKISRRNHVKFFGELKDMRKLSCNDEAFHMSWNKICDITLILLSRKTPSPKKYRRWDEYARSFYLKMCTCFGVDYQNLEAATSRDESIEIKCSKQEEHKECTQPATKEMSYQEHLDEAEVMECSGVNQPNAEEKSFEELLYEAEHMKVFGKPIYLKRPFKMGSYSIGTRPVRIPYHLYLLVKEAADILKGHNNTNDLQHLLLVEKKIRFFCTFFRAHLPSHWKYNRDNASSLIADYDTMGGPKYSMIGYTPFKDWAEADGFDRKIYLSADGIVNIMSIIHSRRTPTFWKMCWQEISFYCKLCSCFGLDYHCLESASEDDVCLMNTGRNC